MPTIDELQIEIRHSTNQAVSGIDSLIDSLTRLKGVTRGGVGLTTVANQLRRLNEAVAGITDPTENIKKLVSALKPLESIQKTNLNSTINSLKKLPDITQQLSEINMDDFASQIRRVTDAIRPLADEMNKVAAGFQAFPTKIQRIISQSNRLTSSNKKLTASYGSLSVRISKIKLQIVALYFGLRRIARSMSEWVKESNDYVENLNLFRITMREASDEALEFANKVQEAFGIDPSEWIRFQAIFQNMTTGFGIAADKATVMSKNLTQLGYDLATVFNVDYEIAMQKLQSALAGQPRPMREWGFDMSEATLKLAAMNHGIKENVETMTQMEKAQIRYLQIFETAKRQGYLQNFAREIHTPANAMRILNEQLRFFKRELGNAIIPLLMKILPYIQAIVKVLTDAARALAAFFGFELPVIDYSGLGAIGDIADDFDDVESGIGGATGAAKKLKNILMGFDEINLLPKDTGTGGIGSGGSSGGIGGGFEIDPSIYDYDFLSGVQSKVNEIADKIQEKVKPIIDFIKDNFDEILSLVKIIGLALLTWKVSKGLLSFLSALGLLSKTKAMQIALGITLMVTGISIVAENIKAILEGKWTNTSLRSLLYNTIGGALAGAGLMVLGVGWWAIPIGIVLSIAITSIITNWQEIKDYFSGLGVMISGAFTGDWDTVVEGYIDAAIAVLKMDMWWTKLGRVIYGEFWDEMIKILEEGGMPKDVRKALRKAWWENFKKGFDYIGLMIAKKIDPYVVNIKSRIATKWSELKPHWDNLTKNVKDKVADFKGKVATKWSDLKYKWEVITNNIKNITADFKARVVTVWSNIRTLWYSLTDNINDKTADFKGRIATRWMDIRMDWNNLLINIQGKTVDFKGRVATRWADLRTTWNNLVSNFKDHTIDFKVKLSTTVGSVKNFVNSLIDSINRNLVAKLDFSFRIPQLFGGGYWGWKAPRIPRLADGGFVNEGQLFIAREAGPEMVGSIGNRTAVANNDQIVSAVSQGVAKAVSSVLGQGGSSGDVILKIGELELGRISKDAINNYNRQTGQVEVRV